MREVVRVRFEAMTDLYGALHQLEPVDYPLVERYAYARRQAGEAHSEAETALVGVDIEWDQPVAMYVAELQKEQQ